MQGLRFIGSSVQMFDNLSNLILYLCLQVWADPSEQERRKQKRAVRLSSLSTFI